MPTGSPERKPQTAWLGKEGAIFKFAILTISDAGSKGEREDTSGDAISQIMGVEGFEQVMRDIIPDEKEQISAKLIEWCDGGKVDLVLTTGGTGLGPRDVTPEATRAIIQIDVPGIPEAIRMQTFQKTPFAVLSRGIAGVRSGVLILNMPGSPRAVREWLEVALPVLPHALEMIKGWRGHPVQ